jgi:hypothetical protein
MADEPKLDEGDYPFIGERLPLSELARIEAPASLEALFRDQAAANDIQLIRGRPVGLRCVTPQYGDAVLMIFWPHDKDRLHMLAPRRFQRGRA